MRLESHSTEHVIRLTTEEELPRENLNDLIRVCDARRVKVIDIVERRFKGAGPKFTKVGVRVRSKWPVGILVHEFAGEGEVQPRWVVLGYGVLVTSFIVG